MKKKIKKEKQRKEEEGRPKRRQIKRPARLIFLLFLLLAIIYLFEYLSPTRMLAGSDWLMGSYPSWKFMAEHINRKGNIAFWHPHIFGGVPTVAAFFGDLFSPATLFRLFISPHLVFVYVFVVFIFLAGLGTYLYLRKIGLDYLPSIIGGLIYMFAGSLVTTTYAGHAGRLGSASAFPWMLFLLHCGLREKRLIYFTLLGVVFAFCFLACHFQLIYYGIVASGFYFLIHLIAERKENKIKGTVKLILFYLVGILVMGLLISIQYLPVYFNLPFAARGQEKGYAFATSWSLPPLEVFDLLVPNFSGILDSYWGENYFKLHSEYLGVLPLFLAGIALLFLFKNRYTKYFCGLGIIALLFSFGGHTPIFRIFYYLPGVSKFRAPSQAFYLVSFSLDVLTGLGLAEVLKIDGDADRLRQLRRYIFSFLTVVVILFIISLLFQNSLLQLLRGYIQRTNPLGTAEKVKNLFENYSSFLGRFLINIILLSLYAIFVWFVARRRRAITVIGILFGILLLFDQWSIGKKFMKSTVPPVEYYAPDEVVNFLKGDKELYRVYPLYYERSNDGILMYYNIHSVGGYHPNPLQSYQEFIGAEKTVMFEPTNLFYKNFLDLLNVKYIIAPFLPEDIKGYDPRTQAMILSWKNFLSQPYYEMVFSGRRSVIYKNKTYLPRVFLVSGYEVVENKEEIFSLLKSDFDPKKKVLLNEVVAFPSHEVKGLPPTTDTTILGDAKVLDYSPNRIEIAVSTNRPGFLVASENYHPDWKATIDGKPTKVYRAYHTFRAVALPEGEHRVIFFYDSPSYKIGSLLSLLGLAFVIGQIVVILLRKR